MWFIRRLRSHSTEWPASVLSCKVNGRSSCPTDDIFKKYSFCHISFSSELYVCLWASQDQLVGLGFSIRVYGQCVYLLDIASFWIASHFFVYSLGIGQPTPYWYNGQYIINPLRLRAHTILAENNTSSVSSWCVWQRYAVC